LGWDRLWNILGLEFYKKKLKLGVLILA